MNRRAALRGLLVPAALMGASIASAAPADEHTYKGRRIRWSGWRQSINQFAEFGFWVAHGDDTRHGQPVFWYATTLGVCDRAGDCEVLDTSSPWRTFAPEPHEREALKARALRLLYDHL